MNHTEINNKEEYLKEFPKDARNETLKAILDIRKFEIDLSWKRAAYFWTFIGATLAGYIALLNSSSPPREGQFILATLGVIFSLCWYLVNRGSKFWQLNWEKHLDILEDDQIGPLYKTTIHRNYYKRKWYVLNAPYPFSVSKINIILSFIVFCLWLGIYIGFVYSNTCLFYQNGLKVNFYTLIFLGAALAVIGLILFGRTGKGSRDEFKTHIHFDQRGFNDETPKKSAEK